MPKTKTDWGHVAPWYDDLLETGANYQKDIILPEILNLLSVNNGDRILDLACGQGFFARALRDAGAKVVGVDMAGELIDIARNYEKDGSSLDGMERINYFVSPSHQLGFISDRTIDKVLLILALQNIEKVEETLTECFRVLRVGGSLIVVLNHPAFRIPKESSWGFDDKEEVQYRRLDKYMSEFKVSINMHPGERKLSFTSSFHRPIQFYFKTIGAAGFLIRTLHELVSNRISLPGKRAEAENQARREIPLFMAIEAVKV